MMTQIAYMYNDCDDMIFGGDYNARIADKADFIVDVDDVKPRCNIDTVSNGHGNSFLEFLTDTRVGVVNGRVTPVYDNFTSISGRGTEVVDHLCANYESLDKFVECKTLTMNCVRRELNSTYPECHLPTVSDHSIILAQFDAFADTSTEADEPQKTSRNEKKATMKGGQPKPVKFKVTGVK